MDFLKCFRLVLIAVIFGMSTAMYSSKVLEGYPAGYLGLVDCPNETAPIPTQDLKHLFMIVRGANSTKKISYNYNQTSLLAKDPYMDWSRKTIVYVSGYTGNPRASDATALEAHYIKLGYNVWCLDEFFFYMTKYSIAQVRVRQIAIYVGKMLADLTQPGLLDPAKVEMISMSLGAHVMSFIAKNYYQRTGKKIGRLIGLDPSGPCFRNKGPADRLDDSDADFVIAVMTNIDGHGIAAPIGHVNFYVNGGEYQVGDIPFIPCGNFCSHMKAYIYWLSALENPGRFIGVKCNSVQQARFRGCYDNVPMVTNIMGIKTDKSKPGIYYLSTKHSFPYYLGKKGLKEKTDKMVRQHILHSM
ncbi:hypothetical protein ABMA28_004405 [Loxostege sticticalis]|uniref:Lipase domain-containing protein n=1 Tax=Loxostege sticticalis TaxID=481309 RepID=A0ABD0SR49_LOXSC